MATIKDRWRAFRQWQQRPYEVALLRNEQCTCSTCGTQFEGNYCPRCGQSGRVGRYSFKKMFQLFLDVWGLGNRSMFRSLRDLILRPGYMIRDYLKGMQMAYFPPFKMFFLLATFSLIISSGLNLKGVNKLKQEDRHVEITIEEDAPSTDSAESKTSEDVNDDTSAESKASEDVNDDISAESKVANNALSDNSQREQERIAAMKAKLKGYSDAIFNFGEKFPNIFSLFGLVLLSGFLYIFFRRCPAIPDLRYSEFLVALVYTSNMYTMYCMALDFLCLDYGLSLVSLALTLLPLKQLSGFKWWRIICYILLASILMTVAFVVVVAAFYLTLSYYYL
ncbi:MAG: DUF3667 domain-containing protein [Prevotella sp.]|nr:DUF3667 domain-containing protein [Prevotella sp.]